MALAAEATREAGTAQKMVWGQVCLTGANPAAEARPLAWVVRPVRVGKLAEEEAETRNK